MSGTEDSILGNIPDFAGDTGGDTGDSSTTSSTPSSPDGGSSTTSAQPGTDARSRSSGTDSAQPQGQIRRRHDGLVEVPNQQNPNTRDLVDPITGRVVAQGGIERRVYEEGQRHARENNQLRQQLQALATQVQGSHSVLEESRRLNVTPDNAVIAVRVMADFMRDPVRTLEYLVEEVKSKGYAIPFLQQGVTPGMDLSAISKMIDGKLQPWTDERARQQRQAQINAAAKQELDGFLGQHSEAHENLDVLAEMLQAQPGLTIQSAYIQMARWAHENGLNPYASLKQQIAAMQQQSTQQPTRTRPLPQGRSAAGGNGVAQQGNGQVVQHNENASWSDIIRDAMRENNINLS